MKNPVHFPIRRKIVLSILFAITLVVSLITFTMARFFHQDKQAYINDWVSIAAVSTAEECQHLLQGYGQRLKVYARILLNEDIREQDRQAMLQSLFDELPELVQLAVLQDDEIVESANNRSALESAGLSVEDLDSQRKSHVLPVEDIRAGRPYLGNATLSPALPSIAIAIALDEGESPLLVRAVLRSDELLRLGAKFKVFEVIVAAEDGTVLAHPDIDRVTGREPANLIEEARTVHAATRDGLTLAFQRDGTDMLGGFAPVEFGHATVAVHIPQAAAYLASRDLLGRLLVVALVLLVVVALIGRTWAYRLTRPVERLSRATRAIARGEFDIQVEVSSRDEIGSLAGSFNQMATELHAREEALEEAQSQLVHSEKMAAFGQLGAGIAHEVKNPLAGVLGCAQLSLMDAEEGSALHENLRLIEKETQRCKEIIESLLKFSRQEKAMLEPTDVNSVAHDAMAIINHQLELNEVQLEPDFAAELPLIYGNGNQLQQVLMNLMINAQHAMGGKPGLVTVRTRRAESSVEIIVEDNGAGMTEDVRTKLFEPFFTTKPTGQGTGLGLSVSFGIIRDHHGQIAVESEPDQGSTFTIRIPVEPETEPIPAPVS